jgi:hypothetical protein
MNRWNISTTRREENPTVDAFINDIVELCKKYNLSLGHEDCEGSFIVVPLSEHNINWLLNAAMETISQ